MVATTIGRGLALAGLALACALAGVAALAAPPGPLPALAADSRHTTVSGLSSGAFMAVQLQVAYSASIVGAGVVAGGPYYCTSFIGANLAAFCMGDLFLKPGGSAAHGAATAAAITHEIDGLDHLKNRRAYVFSGTQDSVVHPPAVAATVEMFRLFGVTGTRLKDVHDLPAGHAFIAPGGANDCGANAAPYLSHCSVDGNPYDQAAAILDHLYAVPKSHASASVAARQVVAFDQRLYAAQIAGMADTGFVYVPASCEATGARCRVHVALHGCVQSAQSVGNQFTNDTGYNRWADSNKLLVLYPQVDKTVLLPNPQGCWDWWGYTGGNYAYKSAPQMQAIMAMVKRLTEKSPGPSPGRDATALAAWPPWRSEPPLPSRSGCRH